MAMDGSTITLTLWHWLVAFLLVVLIVTPFVRILPRARIPAYFGFFAIVPIVPLILLWYMAFKRWPDDPDRR